ncbi:MAG: L-rhamnose isomerase [Acutalibacteraceae bacterium]|nr:L-rhamnose isomerase [Acutalibacteraceae bacterium]
MSYLSAKEKYASVGIDTEAVMEKLEKVAISMHCWQGDDVGGFDSKEALSGGIQTTGNYPGKATTPDELMADMDKALSVVPGKHRINLHACYAIFENGEWADRDELKPRHFAKWVEFAKERGLGIDFNPTFFSHPKAEGLTLSNADEDIRSFWVRHAKCCIDIAQYFANELNTFCTLNIWIPDGMKDIPADRIGPRARLKKSLDEIFAYEFDREKVLITLESKVFGIGLESYTVGSAEFYLSYAAKNSIMPLMDNGHYHPTEYVSDKIPTMLLFNEKIALHITRPVRWDSDHVVLLDDETKEMAKEIVKNDALERVVMALDYFDASINRVAAWVIGMRNWQKALLSAMLTPWNEMKSLQDNCDFTSLMVMSENIKTYPFGEVWDEFCRRTHTPLDDEWYGIIKEYEKEVLMKRG